MSQFNIWFLMSSSVLRVMADDLRTRLLARIEELGLTTQSAAAKKVGVSRSVFAYWVSEDNPSFPALDNVAKVAAFLDISEAEVLAMYPPSYKMRAARSTAKDLAAMLQRQLEVEASERKSNAEALTGLNELVRNISAKIDELVEQLRNDDDKD